MDESRTLQEISEFRKEFEDFRKELYKQNLDTQIKITRLEGKSKLWGAIGGSLATFTSVVFALVIWLIKK